MKYTLTYELMGKYLVHLIKKDISNKNIKKDIKNEYKKIILRSNDIGPNNRLFGSYGLCAFFIAMNRKDNLDPETNINILEKNMRKSKFLKKFMGNSKTYFSNKNMESRRKWSVETHKKKYKNDWVVDVIENSNDFTFGFNYLECGVCKMCRDENCFELAKYLCRLDYMLVDIIGIKLIRTKTIAEGGDYCDFRFINK